MKEQLQPSFIRRNIDNVRVAAGTIALATAGVAAGLYIGSALEEMFDTGPKPEPFELGVVSSCIAGEELRVVDLNTTSDSAVFELSCVEPDALPVAQSKPFGIERIVDNLDPEIAEISRPPENPLIDEYTIEIAGRATPESYIAINDKQDDESPDARSFELYVSSDEHLNIEDYQVVKRGSS